MDRQREDTSQSQTNSSKAKRPRRAVDNKLVSEGISRALARIVYQSQDMELLHTCYQMLGVTCAREAQQKMQQLLDEMMEKADSEKGRGKGQPNAQADEDDAVE
ncbi:uncharacterized protein LOC132193949 [Neocloeon triangulifer]|uniref:uncharacterized protein LOC132193949 n=1 Tax=Neocloeon triangulifer TaxID=2078957 RepID=UPI00286EF394|nr:uncharacterized protein LOC132193949 [Neocloeon triangulifer]